MSLERLPIFPLGLVLLPRMPLPLHIFEERYREMIAHCLDGDVPFGVVLHTGSTTRKIGCLAVIDSVINRYEDGRLDILAIGSDRFHVVEMREERAYLEADVEIFHDDESEDQQKLAELAREATEGLTDFAEVAGYQLDMATIDQLDYEQLSFLMATTDIFSTDEKQELIETTSTARRLEQARQALRESRDRLTRTRKVREILGKSDDEDITHLFN